MLANYYPSQISISVLFDEMSFVLYRVEKSSRVQESNASTGRVLNLEQEVANFQEEIVAMDRRHLRE